MVIGRRAWAVVELVIAAAAASGCAASWSRVRTVVLVAPVTDGEPVTTSLVYHPQWLLSALVLAAVAGVLGFAGAVGVCRARRPRCDGRDYDDSHNELIP